MIFKWTFWRAALIRAARTAAETALSYIGAARLFGEVRWAAVGSAALLGAIVSVLLAVSTGLPEVREEDSEDGD